MSETEKTVLEAMKKAGKPLRPGDVARMTGKDVSEVSKAIQELKEKGKVKSPKRCFYTPAE
ncbi:MAG: helix-turn-helix domain-containing protein [Thermodesulfobacteriota bacterium]